MWPAAQLILSIARVGPGTCCALERLLLLLKSLLNITVLHVDHQYTEKVSRDLQVRSARNNDPPLCLQ